MGGEGGLLLSGGDDQSMRVWDYTRASTVLEPRRSAAVAEEEPRTAESHTVSLTASAAFHTHTHTPAGQAAPLLAAPAPPPPLMRTCSADTMMRTSPCSC
jgi:hypothetical protein